MEGYQLPEDSSDSATYNQDRTPEQKKQLILADTTVGKESLRVPTNEYVRTKLKQAENVYHDTSKVHETPNQSKSAVRNSAGPNLKQSIQNSEGNKSLFYEFDFNEDLTQMNLEEPIASRE